MGYVILFSHAGILAFALCGTCASCVGMANVLSACSYFGYSVSIFNGVYNPSDYIYSYYIGLFIATQVYFYGVNDCKDGWTAMYILVLIWIILGYIIVIELILILCCICCVVAIGSQRSISEHTRSYTGLAFNLA